MKLKAASNLPPDIIARLNSPDFAKDIRQKVFIECLGLKNPGPAEAYIQKTDLMIDMGIGWGCEVRLTGVSVTTSRCTDDLDRALALLEGLYRGVIESALETGERAQLFVSIGADLVPFGKETNLIEGQPIWIEHVNPVPPGD